MATATQDQKIRMTGYVLNYEAQQPGMRDSLYPGMVAQLQALDPWADEGPLWAKWLGTGYWDTWRNLRNRIDAGAPSRAARVSNAAPDSVAGAYASGFAEGAKEGASDLAEAVGKVADVLVTTVKNADKITIGLLILVGIVVVNKIRRI